MIYHYPVGFSFCVISQVFSVLLFWKSLAIASEKGSMEREILPEIMHIYLAIDLVFYFEPKPAHWQGQWPSVVFPYPPGTCGDWTVI